MPSDQQRFFTRKRLLLGVRSALVAILACALSMTIRPGQ